MKHRSAFLVWLTPAVTLGAVEVKRTESAIYGGTFGAALALDFFEL
jgi:hypothetical protein